MDTTLIPLRDLSPSPLNQLVRGQIVVDESLQALADSISVEGVLQPLLVVPTPDGETPFQIVAGERRYRAALLANTLTHLPCIIRQPMDELAQLVLMGAENIQRKNLSPLGEAKYYQVLADRGLTVGDISARLGVGVHHVKSRLDLLQLATPVQEKIDAGTIPLTAGKHLKRLPTEVQIKLSPKLVGRQVSEVEQIVQQVLDRANAPSANNHKPSLRRLDAENRQLRKLLSQLAAHLRKDGDLLARCAEELPDELGEEAFDRSQEIEDALAIVLQ